MWERRDARPAPRGPEVEDDDLALEISEADFLVVDVAHHEIGSDGARGEQAGPGGRGGACSGFGCGVDRGRSNRGATAHAQGAAGGDEGVQVFVRQLDAVAGQRGVGHRDDFWTHADEAGPEGAVGFDERGGGIHADAENRVGHVFRPGFAGGIPGDGEAGVGVSGDPLIEVGFVGGGKHGERDEALIFVGGGGGAEPRLWAVAGAELDQERLAAQA